MSNPGTSGARKRKNGASRRGPREKCVVCATDLSPAAQRALSTAAELAEAFDAKLLVVHGMELWDKRYDFLVKDLEERLAVEAGKKVANELKHLGKSKAVPVEVLIKRGPVIEQIIKVVVERDPLMLVIGSNSSTDPKATHLGGLAQELIRLSPVSVVVARPCTSPDIKRILCAVGGQAGSKDALQWALELARRERVKQITVVHTFEVPTGYLEAGMTFETAREKMLKAHVTAATRSMPPRIHDLLRLAELGGVMLSQEQRDSLASLQKYAIEGRYPDAQLAPLGSDEVQAARDAALAAPVGSVQDALGGTYA